MSWCNPLTTILRPLIRCLTAFNLSRSSSRGPLISGLTSTLVHHPSVFSSSPRVLFRRQTCWKRPSPWLSVCCRASPMAGLQRSTSTTSSQTQNPQPRAPSHRLHPRTPSLVSCVCLSGPRRMSLLTPAQHSTGQCLPSLLLGDCPSL